MPTSRHSCYNHSLRWSPGLNTLEFHIESRFASLLLLRTQNLLSLYVLHNQWGYSQVWHLSRLYWTCACARVLTESQQHKTEPHHWWISIQTLIINRSRLHTHIQVVRIHVCHSKMNLCLGLERAYREMMKGWLSIERIFFSSFKCSTCLNQITSLFLSIFKAYGVLGSSFFRTNQTLPKDPVPWGECWLTNSGEEIKLI